MIGALWLMPAIGLYWFEVAASQRIEFAVALFAYGLLVLRQGQKRVLDTIVPPEIREQVRRERRRAARRGDS
jgi:hypothetical protein